MICMLSRRIFRDDLKNVGSSVVQRFLHSILQRERRGRTTAAGAVQLQPNDAVAHADQIAIAAMRLEIGPNGLQAAQHPGFYVVGMKRVEQKHAGHKIILQRLPQDALALWCFKALVYQALQRRPMQFNYGLNQTKRGGPGLRVGRLIEFGSQLLYSLRLRAELSAPGRRQRLLGVDRRR